eukprot:1156595-Pelagomonas_calceolata.AAC.3
MDAGSADRLAQHDLHITSKSLTALYLPTRYKAWCPVRSLTAATQTTAPTTSGAEITLHTILLDVGGTIYIAHTLDQLKKLGIDPQRPTKLARKLHATLSELVVGPSLEPPEALPLETAQFSSVFESGLLIDVASQ